VTFAQLDINDKSSIANFAGMIKANYGGFDILVNNAAIAYKGRDPTPFAEQARPTLCMLLLLPSEKNTHKNKHTQTHKYTQRERKTNTQRYKRKRKRERETQRSHIDR